MSKMKLSSVEKIVRFISDIDIKTTIPQNIVFLAAILFIVFAKGNYALKLKVNYFLVITSLFFVILCVFRKYYNIICQFTILNQSFALLVYCLLLFSTSGYYKQNKSFRKNIVYEKKLPDGLLYYGQKPQLNTEVEFSKHRMKIEFFEVFDDIYRSKDILCFIKIIDKKTNHEEKVLASFEETLAMVCETGNKYTKVKLYDLLLEQAELLSKKNNKDIFYKKIIDKIKVYKKRLNKFDNKYFNAG